jgi:hypothetical protein
MRRFVLILFAIVLLPYAAHAKRTAPAKVDPVIYQGVRYVAPNDDGRRAYIEAWDVATNKTLWELTVFTNHIDPKLEEDVQLVFIKALTVRDGTLMVTSERGTTYRVDLKSKAVAQSDLAWSQAPDAAAQRNNIPETIERAISKGPLAKDYEVSFHLNPFYLRGDFNGDGKVDVAVLVKQRSTGKLGIAIIPGGASKAAILGAGAPLGNGGDDFDWMDNWQVYPKGRVGRGTGEPSVHRLHADALLVGKSEAASGLIHWDGKHYVWFQQGD